MASAENVNARPVDQRSRRGEESGGYGGDGRQRSPSRIGQRPRGLHAHRETTRDAALELRREPRGAGGASVGRCGGCGEQLTGRYLVSPADGRGYHPACLRCDRCRLPAETFVAVPSRPGMHCCRRCHDEAFAERCSRCNAPLQGPVVVAMGGKWHKDCFRCSICHGSAASSFVEHECKPVCERCHVEHVAEKCYGCSRGIAGEYIDAMGRKYHRRCFTCVVCGKGVASRFVPHDGEPYCDGCFASRVAEKCACGCGQGIVGKYVTALGGKFMDGHFRCVECGKPPRGGKFMKIPLSSSRAKGVEDASGRAGGENAVGDDRPVAICEGCYATHHCEKCAACAKVLVNCSYMKTDLGELMCSTCERTPGTLCDDCGRCVPRESTLKQQRADTREGRFTGVQIRRTARRQSGGTAVIGQCETCAATAVSDEREASTLLDKVVVAMAAMGARGAPEGRNIPLQLVDADRLARAAAKRHRGPHGSGPRGVTRTKVVLEGSAPQTQWLEIVDGWALERLKSGYGAGNELRFKHSPGTTAAKAAEALAHPEVSVRERRYLKGIMALRGMSRTAMGAVLAHEYGHCYMFMRRFPSLPMRTEEGMCELFAWLWLGGWSGSKEHARRRQLIEERKDAIYGDGFRLAKKGLDACRGDLSALLVHVYRHKEFPS